MTGVNITQGTQSNIQTDTVGTTNYQVIKLDVGAAGASSLFTGTLKEVSNLVKGTVTKLEGGTVGVLAAGTVSTLGLVHADAWATVVSTGTTTLGTIKAAVSGSSIYVTDIIISAGSATTVVVASGGTSTPLIGSLQFAQYGGMVSNFRTPLITTAGSPLVYQQSVGCPLSVTAQGYVK